MATITIEANQLKALMKSAVLEALDERHEAEMEEAMEDMALARAMDEAERSPLVPREEIFAILESKA
jgi:hypothetical protein